MKLIPIAIGSCLVILGIVVALLLFVNYDDGDELSVDPGKSVYLTIDPVTVKTDTMNEVLVHVTWHNPTKDDIFVSYVEKDRGADTLIRRTISFPKMAVEWERPHIPNKIIISFVHFPESRIPAGGSMTQQTHMRILPEGNSLVEGMNECYFTYDFHTDLSRKKEDSNSQRVTGAGVVTITVQK